MIVKFIKNKKGLSPAISAIILVAVSVSYAFVAASWVGEMTVSMMSLEELQISECDWAQDYSHADLRIKNTGTQGAVLSSLQINGAVIEDFEVIEGNIRINPGRSTTIRVTQDFTESTKYEFKLTTKRQTPIQIIAVSQPEPETQNQASIHYVNSISDIDGSEDKGTHSNFANQQGGPNNLFDTITEGDYGVGLTSIVQYPDVFTVNYGIQTDFANAQENNPDGDYMLLQEENLGVTDGYPSVRSKTHSIESSNTINHDISLPDTIEEGDTLLVVFVCDDDEQQLTWENEGKEWNVIYEEYAGSKGPTMSIAWKKAIGNEDGNTIRVTTGSKEGSVHISYAIQGASDPSIVPPEASLDANGNNKNPNPKDLTPSGGLQNYLWFAFAGNDDDDHTTSYPSNYPDNQESYDDGYSCNIAAATKQQAASTDNPDQFTISSSEQWEAATVVVYPDQDVVDDFELNFEYQWTNADFDETSEQVCIYVETATQNGEKLVAYERNGENWETLGVLNSDGWNNFTASYLTGTTYTISLQDQDNLNETIQSSWNIDCIITNCSSTETNYEADIEVQFNDVNVGNNYEEICIFMGSTTAEPLDVYIRNQETWELLSNNLMPNKWNNMTYSISQNTVTLRFLGSIETNDQIQDSWEIDTVLLYGPP